MQSRNAFVAVVFSSIFACAAFGEEEFTSLFNGKDLAGWRGDESLWSVRDGCIVGQTTAEHPIKPNQFLISKDTFDDFELRIEFKISAHNSGVQYRSAERKDVADYVVAGYQADIDYENKYTGICYEERGRGILAKRGEKITIGSDHKPQVTGSVGEEADIAKAVRKDDWNEYIITARGNHLVEKINGVTTVDVTDEDVEKRATSGIIALQLHAGQPMMVQFKNIRIKKLAKPATTQSTNDANMPEWIWGGPKAAQDEVVFFRKTFRVDGGVKAATLTGACDNAMKLFLNGRRVITTSGWETPIKIDVTRNIKDGPNLLAVRGQNKEAVAALLVLLELKFADGRTQSIISDESWRCSADEPPAWQRLSFDDSHWHEAHSFGKHGTAPWGDVLSRAAPTVPATAAESLKLLPGFKAELIYTVPKSQQGSWVSMTFDNKGRIIASDQGGSLYRVTLPHDGKPIDVEPIDIEIGQAQGLLWAYDSLYVSVNGDAGMGSGFYRVRDTDGDDQFDEVKLLKKFTGAGEHGPHAIQLGPDGMLYVMAGNFTKPPAYCAPTSPHRNFKEDQLLPRLADARGHDPNQMAPGGWIARTDKDGREWELWCGGFRNSYDFAFNPDGEIFTYDSDMEWDIGLPWYRPTRANHAVCAAEFGWRNGSGKWPADYPDSLPGYDVGLGSPTGVCFGTGAKFPAKYQRAFFMLDWAYGNIYAMHFTPVGATYTETHEKFCIGKPLAVTDVAIGRDGAMYFTVGGRSSQSALYRISYIGNESTRPAGPIVDRAAAEARALRHHLEEFHYRADAAAIVFAWPYLGSPDRYIRYAARIALERQDVPLWAERALAETRIEASLNALLALARVGPKEYQSRLLDVLAHIPLAKLTEQQQIAVLRIYALSFMRMAKPDAPTAETIAGLLDPLYPAKTERLNRELCITLVYLQSPDVVAKTIKLLGDAPTQQEQIHYVAALRVMKTGWTPELRRKYFEWFVMSRKYTGGNSFKGFIANIRTEAIATLTDDEKADLKDVLSVPTSQPIETAVPPHQFVKDWQMKDLVAALSQADHGRSYEKGETAFAVVQCGICHNFRVHSASIGLGPDLTGVGNRFSAADLLENILEPSKVISDQYQTIEIRTKDDAFAGRIETEDDQKIVLRTSPLAKQPVTILKKDVRSRKVSKISTMPTGLLNVLTKDEILDLNAYLRSGGDPSDKAFAK